MTSRRIFFLLLSSMVLLSCSDERQRPILDFGSNNPAQSGSRYPDLFSEDGQTIFMSWISRVDERVSAVEFTSFQDGRWQNPLPVRVGSNLVPDPVETPTAVSHEGEPVAVQWVRSLDSGPGAYDIQISFPVGPRQWNHVTPHLEGTGLSHGFASMLPLGPETVLATWLEGGLVEDAASLSAGVDRRMQLRSAIVHSDGSREQEQLLHSGVCSRADMVLTEGGAVAAFRVSGNDIQVARYDAGQGEWDRPETVAGEGPADAVCPGSGPSLSAGGDSVAIAWYSGEGENVSLQAAFSADGGSTFRNPVELAAGPALGRMDIDAAPDGSFFISWMEQSGSLARIYLRKIENGQWGADPVLIGSTDADSLSGYPKIAAIHDGVMLAWTQTQPFFRLRTAFYPYETEIETRSNGQAVSP